MTADLGVLASSLCAHLRAKGVRAAVASGKGRVAIATPDGVLFVAVEP